MRLDLAYFIDEGVPERILGDIDCVIGIYRRSQRLEKEKKPYDIILMDIQMPEMNGLQATRMIRSRLPAGEQPRIVAMTAYTMQGRREQCLAVGMDEYISKLVKMEDLEVALERTAESF